MTMYEVELFDDTIQIEADSWKEEFYETTNLKGERSEGFQYVFYKDGEPTVYVPKWFVVKPIREIG